MSCRQGWKSSGVEVPVPSVAFIQTVSTSGAYSTQAADGCPCRDRQLRAVFSGVSRRSMFYGSVLPAFARSARSSNTTLFSA